MERAHRHASELTKSSIDTDGDVEVVGSSPLRPTTCNATLPCFRCCAANQKAASQCAYPSAVVVAAGLAAAVFACSTSSSESSQTYAQEWVRRAGINMSKSTGQGARGSASSSANPVSELALSSATAVSTSDSTPKPDGLSSSQPAIPARHSYQIQRRVTSASSPAPTAWTSAGRVYRSRRH